MAVPFAVYTTPLTSALTVVVCGSRTKITYFKDATLLSFWEARVSLGDVGESPHRA